MDDFWKPTPQMPVFINAGKAEIGDGGKSNTIDSLGGSDLPFVNLAKERFE